jgi:hypothetical protein
MEGLLQKYYVRDDETGRVGGIYVFDSAASRDALFESEVHAKLRDGADVRDLDVTTFEVVFPLYGDATDPRPTHASRRPPKR